MDVSGLAFVYVKYSKYVQGKTDFGKKYIVTRFSNKKKLRFLGLNFFNDERDFGNADESIFIYTDKIMRQVVRNVV